MKNTKILQKYMAIPDYKKDEKFMLQNINISKNNTDFLDMTYVKTVIKKYTQKEQTFMLQDIKTLKNNADSLDIISLILSSKRLKNSRNT